jgi:hypothetical protein
MKTNALFFLDASPKSTQKQGRLFRSPHKHTAARVHAHALMPGNSR